MNPPVYQHSFRLMKPEFQPDAPFFPPIRMMQSEQQNQAYAAYSYPQVAPPLSPYVFHTAPYPSRPSPFRQNLPATSPVQGLGPKPGVYKPLHVMEKENAAVVEGHRQDEPVDPDIQCEDSPVITDSLNNKLLYH